MSAHNMHFHDRKMFLKISLNICFFLNYWKNLQGTKNKFESAKVNKPFVFKSLKLYCTTTCTQLDSRTKDLETEQITNAKESFI